MKPGGGAPDSAAGEPAQTEAPSLVQGLRALPREAWVLYAGTLINRFGGFVVVFLIVYLTERGYSPAEAGGAAAAYGVGAIAAALVGGHLADRLGRKHSIALSMSASAAAMLLLSQAETLAVITPLVALAGFAAELYRPAAGALLTDLTPPGQRLTAFALYRTVINAGIALGPAVAGLLAERSFLWLFVGDAVTSVIYGVLALAYLPHGVRVRAAAEPPGGILRALRTDRGLLALLLGMLALTFVLFQSEVGLPLHMTELGLSYFSFGLLISLNAALVTVFELPLTVWTRRLPPRIAIAAGFLLMGLGFAATGLARDMPVLIATVLIWTLGEIVSMPVAAAYVAEIAPDHLRGRYQAAFGLSFAVGFALGPAVGGPLFGWRPDVLWAACLGLGVLSAALVLFVAEPAAARRRAAAGAT